MNLLQCFICEVHSVDEVTNYFADAKERMYEVDVTYDCYGVVRRNKIVLCERELNDAVDKGFFFS